MVSGQSNDAETTCCVLAPLSHVAPVNCIVVSSIKDNNWNIEWIPRHVPVGVTTYKTLHISIAPFVMSARFEAGREFPTQAL